MRGKALVLTALAALLAAAAATRTTDARAGAPAGKDDGPLVELGRRLFFDPAVGRQGRVGCSSCHDPEHGFSDARPHSIDETRELVRHSQSLVDLTGPGFHWDGEFRTPRELIDARI